MAKVKYSEVQVGQSFTYEGKKYVRTPHLRARFIDNKLATYVSFGKHTIVDCENPYGKFEK